MARRALNESERILWEQVIRTVRPLDRESIANSAGHAPRARPSSSSPTRAGSLTRANLAPAHISHLPEGTLDGGWDRRLARGVILPDRIVDLHGHSLARAYDRLDGALEEAITNGERVLLLVTGHAPRGDPFIRRGAIRVAVGDWLAASRHAARIAAVRAAHPRHGGAGALYIILKRARASRT